MRITSSPAGQRDRTPFFGRARETKLLQEELRRGVSLLTISGPSGMGKTRLARQVANGLVAHFEEGGAWFCDLAAIKDVVELEDAVARMLGIPGASASSLSRAIANRGRLLLVLDNLDAVAAQVDEVVGAWLDACDELQILATSILPIGMDGEVRFNLAPLELKDATALYLERARRAGGLQDFTEHDRPAVVELVGRLDRIPLAIELAAARVQVLPPKALLFRIDERFELLRSQQKGRHGSLLEALTLTWELLSEREQQALARASVFEQGFTYEAATRVLRDGDGADAVDVIDRLTALRSRSLVQVEGTEHLRFFLLESVRDHARQELRRSGLFAETLERHTAFFLERGEEAAAKIGGPGELGATRWIQEGGSRRSTTRSATDDPTPASRGSSGAPTVAWPPAIERSPGGEGRPACKARVRIYRVPR